MFSRLLFMKINIAFAVGIVVITAITSLSTIISVNYATSQYEASVSGSMTPQESQWSCKCPYKIFWVSGQGEDASSESIKWAKEWAKRNKTSVEQLALGSSGFFSAPTMETMDASIKKIVDATKAGNKVLLIGYSLGASYAQYYADLAKSPCVTTVSIDPMLLNDKIFGNTFLDFGKAFGDAANIVQAVGNEILANPNYVNWSNGMLINPLNFSDHYPLSNHYPWYKGNAVQKKEIADLDKKLTNLNSSCKDGPLDYCPNIVGNQAILNDKPDGMGNPLYKNNAQDMAEKCYWKSTKTATCYDRQTSGGVPVTKTGSASSYVSQADADQKAQLAANLALSKATGGRCGSLYYNTDQTAKCPAGYTGSKTIESPTSAQITADKADTTIWKYKALSQADANTAALTDAQAMVDKDITDKAYLICKPLVTSSCDTSTVAGMLGGVSERIRATQFSFAEMTDPKTTADTAILWLSGAAQSYVDLSKPIDGNAATSFSVAAQSYTTESFKVAANIPSSGPYTAAHVAAALKVLKATRLTFSGNWNNPVIWGIASSGKFSQSIENLPNGAHVDAEIVKMKTAALETARNNPTISAGGTSGAHADVTANDGSGIAASLSWTIFSARWGLYGGATLPMAANVEYFARPVKTGMASNEFGNTTLKENVWQSVGSTAAPAGASVVDSPQIGKDAVPAEWPTGPSPYLDTGRYRLSKGYIIPEFGGVVRWQFKCNP